MPGRRALEPMWDVTKTRSPQTIGEETPRPRRGAFQAIFSSRLHFTGRPVSGETPVPRGPRHWGQLSAQVIEVRSRIRGMAARTVTSLLAGSCTKQAADRGADRR